MQKEYLNYIALNKAQNMRKRVFEVIFSSLFLPLFLVVYGLLYLRSKMSNKSIFMEKTYFLNAYRGIELKLFNSESIFLRKLSLLVYVFTGEIHLCGIALIEYNKSIPYDFFQKPALFSLWFIRNSLKMPNITVRTCNYEYLEQSSIISDIKIILKSFIAMIFDIKDASFKTKVKLFETSFDNITTKDVLNKISSSIEKKVQHTIFFINADCLNKTYKNKSYQEDLNAADTILADGSGVNLACKIINTPLKQNLNGTDLLPNICRLSLEKSYKIFLLGASSGVAKTMSKKLKEQYPNLQIVGTHHGFINNANKTKVLDYINKTQADILFVAMGAPIQEKFIIENKKHLDAKVLIAVGGLFDFYSNRIKRAPMYLRELGLEWIYRMIQEPKRMWKRYILGNPLFIYRTYKFKRSNDLINEYLNTYDKEKNKSFGKFLWELNILAQRILKRVVDIVASSILIVLFMPLFLIVAFCIRYESKGAVLFTQDRVGRKGELFKMYKFRSMVQNAQELKEKLQRQNESKDGVIFKMKDDPRITRVGKFIRKTSIDELPQLLNVLLGEMSLVGPRPPIMSEVVLYNINDKKRLDVKPGITCIWQVSGRSNIPFKQQVEMDKEYIKSQSLVKDIVLLLKTVPAVLLQKGSY